MHSEQSDNGPGVPKKMYGSTKIWLLGGLAALALAVIVVATMSAIGGGSGSPRDVAEDLVSSIAEFDCDHVQELVTDQFAEGGLPCFSREEVEERGVDISKIDVSQEIGEASISGDEASVPVTRTTTVEGQTTTEEFVLNLVNTDGGWMVEGIEFSGLEGLDVPE